ncbi:hypothetical protein K437DRAFT_244218 [Tilletiaria anomala UBC 951]|uniref:U3 small nucleolar RNA-associated protein 10 n=1 Tax=Tilletiaria anomala (strain ATCC 24038 / CBS 436.72 / UBC 951) TaxID=1037660 RepID=A0A066WDN2_TILAU|nr:uncharacterized protein K437DRAFT_244218 [Tilletiaria anomala UBC 951]KDN52062.1 hypothetical protein K437DRAFT_244218 [Tilletiaria anomala UBC 951]
MATALSSQLSSLRSLNAQRLTTSAAVRHAHAPTSYLFSSRDASRQDLRTVHAIAVNGWDELCRSHPHVAGSWAGGAEGSAQGSKDAESASAVELLFGQSSITRDRTVLGKEENAQIDAALAAWFHQFGALLLEKSASKCIEWLVRRFRVHDFNTHLFISAFLPYHATPQFARVVQIADLSKAPLLASFLAPYQQHLKKASADGDREADDLVGPGLPISTLLTALTRDIRSTNALALLRWVASLISSSTSSAGASSSTSISASKQPPHRALLAFWTSVLVHLCVLTTNQQSQCGSTSSGFSTNQAQGKAKKSTNNNAVGRADEHQAILAVILPAATGLAARSARSLATINGSTDLNSHIGKAKKSRKSHALTKATQTESVHVHAWSEAHKAACMLLCAVASCFELSTQAVSACLREILPPSKPNAEARLVASEPETRATLAACYALSSRVPLPGGAGQEESDGELSACLLSKAHLRALLALPRVQAILDQDLQSAAFQVDQFLAHLTHALLACLHEGGTEGEDLQAQADILKSVALAEQTPQELRVTIGKALIALPLQSSSAAGQGKSTGTHCQSAHAVRVRILAEMRQRSPEFFERALQGFLQSHALADPETGKGTHKLKHKASKAIVTSKTDSVAQQHVAVLLQQLIMENTLSHLPAHASCADDGDQSLWLAVHSSNAAERDVALRSILSKIDTSLIAPGLGEVGIIDDRTEAREVLKGLVLARLSDDSVDVLRTLFSAEMSSENVLLKLAKPEEVLEAILANFDLFHTPSSVLNLTSENAAQRFSTHLSFMVSHVLPSCARSGGTHAEEAARKIFERAVFPLFAYTTNTASLAQRAWCALASTPATSNGGTKADNWATALLVQLRTLCGALVALERQEDLVKANDQIAACIARGAVDATPFFVGWARRMLTSEIALSASSPTQLATAPPAALACLVLIHIAQQRLPQNDAQLIEREEILRLASAMFDSAPVSLSVEDGKDGSFKDAALASLANHRGVAPKTVALLALALVAAQTTSLAGDEARLSQQFYIGDESVAARFADTCYRSIVTFGNGTHGGLASIHAWQLLGSWLAGLKQAALPCLAQVWTDKGVATATRLQALVHARALVQAFMPSTTYAGQAPAVDFQTLIPAVLHSLADPEEHIRRAATACLRSIQNVHSNHGRSQDRAVFAFDVIYGAASSQQLQYLHANDVATFLGAVLDTDAGAGTGAEAFVRDSQHLHSFCTVRLTATKADGRKEAAFKNAVLCWLLSHTVCWPNNAAKVALLSILESVRSAHKLQILLNGLKSLVAQVEEVQVIQGNDRECLRLLFGVFDRSTRASLEGGSDAWRFLLSSLKSPQNLVRQYACVALAAVFQSVPADLRQQAVRTLAAQIGLVRESTSAALSTCLRRLPLDAGIFTAALAHFRHATLGNSAASDMPPSKKLRRTEDAAVDNGSAARALSILLDVAHDRKVSLSSSLVGELFEDMKVIVDQRNSGLFNSELVLQHALGTLNAGLGPDINKDPTIMQSFRVDALATIIKLPLSSSLLHAVLRLMAKVAHYAPEQVVHNVMPIFTFVGSSVLSRDDQASFAIVESTIRDIVPALTANVRSELKGADEFALFLRCRDFLRIFTGAANHMPRHRRTSVFKLLIDVLGPADFLGPTLMLLIDRHTNKILKSSRSDARDVALELPLAVFAQYGQAMQGKALTQCLQEVERLVAIGEADPITAASSVFLDRLADTNSEHAPALQNGPRQGAAILSFIARAIAASEPSQEILQLASQKALAYADTSLTPVNTVSERLLEHCTTSMPSDSHVAFVLELLRVKKTVPRGINLLLRRCEVGSFADRASIGEHLGDLTPVTILAAGSESVDLAGSASRLLLLLSEDAKSQDGASWAPSLPSLIALARTSSAHQGILLGTLSNLVPKLGPRLIPQLSQMVSVCEAALEKRCPEGVLQSALQLLNRLSKTSPTFMTSNLQTVIRLNIDLTVASRGSPQPLASTLTRYYQPEEILTCLSALWDQKVSAGTLPLIAILDLLRRLLSHVNRTTTARIYKHVFRFILKVFDLRQVNNSTTEVDKTEAACSRAFIQMILKLNENTFRPLFLRLYDWAAVDLVEEGLPLKDARVRSRCLTFYCFFTKLQDQLKVLVASYYAIALDFTLEGLTALADGVIDDRALWAAMMASLAKSAQHDEGNFWNTARAGRTVPVLVQGLNIAGEYGVDMVAKETATALCAIAQVVPEDAVLQTFNRELLIKARSSQTETVLAALIVLETFWSTVGEDLLSLVPETAPFLSEVLGRADVEIVEHAQDLVRAIERVLGEPLDQYLL